MQKWELDLGSFSGGNCRTCVLVSGEHQLHVSVYFVGTIGQKPNYDARTTSPQSLPPSSFIRHERPACRSEIEVSQKSFMRTRWPTHIPSAAQLRRIAGSRAAELCRAEQRYAAALCRAERLWPMLSHATLFAGTTLRVTFLASSRVCSDSTQFLHFRFKLGKVVCTIES